MPELTEWQIFGENNPFVFNLPSLGQDTNFTLCFCNLNTSYEYATAFFFIPLCSPSFTLHLFHWFLVAFFLHNHMMTPDILLSDHPASPSPSSSSSSSSSAVCRVSPCPSCASPASSALIKWPGTLPHTHTHTHTHTLKRCCWWYTQLKGIDHQILSFTHSKLTFCFFCATQKEKSSSKFMHIFTVFVMVEYIHHVVMWPVASLHCHLHIFPMASWDSVVSTGCALHCLSYFAYCFCEFRHLSLVTLRPNSHTYALFYDVL